MIAWPLALALFFGALLVLLFIGLPVFVAFLIVNVAGTVLLMGPRGFGLFTNSVYETATNGLLATIPLFVLMGEILFRSNSVEVLFGAVDRLVGRVRGRLYAVVVALSTAFGALSGSAVAVAAMLGRSVLPLMAERGYDRQLSAGTILAGASLAPIIPPSLLAIVVGSLADVSIAGLLIAGVLPGLLLGGLTLLWVFAGVARRPALAPADPVPRAVGADAAPDDARRPSLSVAGALLRTTPFLLVIGSVMGLIVFGIATPSESAATGVIGCIATAALYRRLSLSMLVQAVGSAVAISAMILVIVASSKLFSQLLAFTGATRAVVTWATGLDLDPIVMFAILMLIPLLLCMFIDQIAFLLMAVPIYGPLVAALGFDPIWFWTLFLINLTLGSLTPPFGYTLFALAGAAPTLGMARIYRAALPVVAIFVLGIVLMAVWPGIVTWLPGRL